jgi:segregation and condensation protein A
MSVWQVKLPQFEGPMDLLLFLVSKQEYDIMDLPMADITENYLAVMDSIGIENLEDAGEYVVMAATLISIKAKMLLPRPPAQESDEISDPRRELAERLLLYQKTKEEAENLAKREAAMAERFDMPRPAVPPMAATPPEENLVPMTLYDLTRAIEDVVARRNERRVHQVRLDKVSLDERIRWVLDLVGESERFGFLRLLSTEMERLMWVVSFLAILELTKRQQVRIDQNTAFAEIYVCRPVVTDPEPTPELEAA